MTCYPEAAKLPKQFKFADRMGMKAVLVLGPDELAQGRVIAFSMPLGLSLGRPFKPLSGAISSRSAAFSAFSRALSSKTCSSNAFSSSRPSPEISRIDLGHTSREF